MLAMHGCGCFDNKECMFIGIFKKRIPTFIKFPLYFYVTATTSKTADF